METCDLPSTTLRDPIPGQRDGASSQSVSQVTGETWVSRSDRVAANLLSGIQSSNPQEDVWQHTRQRVTHNHCLERLGVRMDATATGHQEPKETSGQVLRLLTN